jgi:hypothetical protein
MATDHDGESRHYHEKLRGPAIILTGMGPEYLHAGFMDAAWRQEACWAPQGGCLPWLRVYGVNRGLARQCEVDNPSPAAVYKAGIWLSGPLDGNNTNLTHITNC